MKKSFNPILDAARAKARELALGALRSLLSGSASIAGAASSRIQVIVRLTPAARVRLRNASQVYRLSEQELVERFALTLPEPTEAPKLPSSLTCGALE
jgi:hypothetical protein